MDQREYEKNLIDHIIDCIEHHGGKECLSSIILTGSLGRSEATYETYPDGEICLRSDVEMALVFPRMLQKKKVEAVIHQVSREFKEDLNLMAMEERRVKKAENFNFSFITPRYKTLFTFDLFNGSRTIWGKDLIRGKDIPSEMIDPYEAKRLIANRIGEFVYLQSSENPDKKEYQRMQWKGKLVLAIAGAWLVMEGKYTSCYCGQYEKIKTDREKAENIIGKDFVLEYERTVAFLRGNGDVYEITDKLLLEYIRNMDLYFQEKEIKKPRTNSISRYLKYIPKYVKSGMLFGFRRFEDKILQALISDFWQESDRLYRDAQIWHSVLY